MGDTPHHTIRELDIRQLTITTAMSYLQARTVYDMAVQASGPARALDVAGRVADACAMGISLIGPIATLAEVLRSAPAHISPDVVKRITERFAELVYESGYAAGANAAVAAKLTVPTPAGFDRLAAEHAQMRTTADRIAGELGHPRGYRYAGGPVDWTSGLPADSACAWYRWKSARLAQLDTAGLSRHLTGATA
jgi:hypothetical protein